jgi:hypothetical protein
MEHVKLTCYKDATVHRSFSASTASLEVDSVDSAEDCAAQIALDSFQGLSGS